MKQRFEQTNQRAKKSIRAKRSMIGFLFGAVLAGALTGCIGYVHEPHGGGGYAEGPPVYAEGGVAVQPEYVYYPGYEVYYSSHTRQYIYRDGRSWVSRGAPPHVSANVLLASPSVGLNFHDHPSNHHATVVRQYPKHWAPPNQGSRHNQGYDEHN